MNVAKIYNHDDIDKPNWKAKVLELTALAANGKDCDENGEFAAANFQLLKENKFFSMAIPRELGGGGASYAEVCEVVRALGQSCGSTALSYSMHSHPLAANVFKHLHGDEKATATLKKIAANELIIAGTGANDWLSSSGKAIKVEGGYRVTAHKHFVSGGPGAQVFVTSAVYEGDSGEEVLHFSLPFSSDGVSHHSNWNTLGMRATGSNDISLEDVFVAEEAIIVRRPVGEWHPMWNVILPIAMPLIMSTYMGIADAAVELAKTAAAKRPGDLAVVLGEMLNSHTTATLAVEDMIRKNNNYEFKPTNENSNAILTRKTLVTTATQKTVELAAEIVGGVGFFKGHPMERIGRDIRAAHFHPLPYRRQYAFSGRIALGLDPVHG